MSTSFNSYSNSNLAEVAARVVEELSGEGDSDGFHDEFNFGRDLDLQSVKREDDGGDDEEELGFEFEFVTKNSESISADEIFHNGKIRAVYPIFDRDLSIGRRGTMEKGKGTKAIRLPLMKLFVEERETETTSSSTSSEADELDGVAEEMYCVWQPKSSGSSSDTADKVDGVPEEMFCVWRPKPAAAAETDGRYPKSSSTGSVYKKWKLKDLLPRSHSHSEGRKDRGVFLTLRGGGRNRENVEKFKERAVVAGRLKPVAPPHPSLYNRDGGEKRRTYLPYRPDLVGFFYNVGFQ